MSLSLNDFFISDLAIILEFNYIMKNIPFLGTVSRYKRHYKLASGKNQTGNIVQKGGNQIE